MRSVVHRLRGYAWTTLLLVASVLAALGHEFAAAITIILIAIKNAWIVSQLQYRASAASSTLWRRFFPDSHEVPRAGRSLLEHTVVASWRGTLSSALLGECAILLVGAGTHLTAKTTAFYAAALLVATVPAGLGAETFMQIRFAPAKWLPKTHHELYRLACDDSFALVLLLLISLVATTAVHAPAAVSIVQIIVFSCVLQVILRLCLGWQEHAAHQATRAQQIGFGITAALLTYGNFVFFFVRQQLSLRYLSASSAAYGQAAAIALATLFACQVVQLGIAYRRPLLSDKRFRRILLSFSTTAVLVLLVVIYLPWTQHYFSSAALSIADWATVIAAGCLCCAAWLAWRYLSQHSRGAVLQLHRKGNR